jgi:hypothetical protein
MRTCEVEAKVASLRLCDRESDSPTGQQNARVTVHLTRHPVRAASQHTRTPDRERAGPRQLADRGRAILVASPDRVSAERAIPDEAQAFHFHNIHERHNRVAPEPRGGLEVVRCAERSIDPCGSIVSPRRVRADRDPLGLTPSTSSSAALVFGSCVKAATVSHPLV